jgi:hypothetical protein
VNADKYAWSKLNKLQLGKYAEYYVKMEFTLYGLDVYTTEVDDEGIDFVVKTESGKFFSIQVKSIREEKSNYVFVPKHIWDHKLPDALFVALVIFRESELPQIYLIPVSVWNNPNSLFVSRDYEGKKSKAEWGISITKSNWQLLHGFSCERVLSEYLL